MSTAISWTNETWNPVVGCEAVSEGCDHCYAKTLHDMRHKAFLAGKNVLPQYAMPFETVQLKPDRLTNPMHWKAPRRVFVNSVSDLFHKDVPLDFLDRCFVVMGFCRRHTFQILTKRPHRMRDYMKSWEGPTTGAMADRWDVARRWLRGQLDPRSAITRNNLREARARKIRAQQDYVGIGMAHRVPTDFTNIWLGTSVEHQAAADKRIPMLLDTPAHVRFLSCEPLLGPVDLMPLQIQHYAPDRRIDWVIVGGESGDKRREMDMRWMAEIVGHCRASGVPVFVKQDSAPKSEDRGRIPDDLWVRQYPA